MAASAGDHCLDVHTDHDHHRSVLWLAGPDVVAAAQAVTTLAVAELTLQDHEGVHPRIGVVDVVPFVPIDATATMGDALTARNAFAAWAANTLALPCFLYGPERTLPDIRKQAFWPLLPDLGPEEPHPTAGAAAVGVRGPLVAYNLWLAEPNLDAARAIARSLRSAAVRTLALRVGEHVQVSCNLIDPATVGPAVVYDAVAQQAPVARAELVGLIGRDVLTEIPEHRWAELDLSESRTVESRLKN